MIIASAHSLHRVTAVLFLSYVLVSSMWAPFVAAKRAQFGPTLASKMQEPSRPAYREGELLIRFRPGVSQPVKDLIVSTHGARRKKVFRGESGVEELQLPRGREWSAALELLMNSQVEFAEPNFLIAKEDLTPNDPQFHEQWSLSNTGQSGGQHGADINASGAWQTTTGSSAAVVAVIDSGIDFTHPDLINNEWTNPQPAVNGDLHGWDFITDNFPIELL